MHFSHKQEVLVFESQQCLTVIRHIYWHSDHVTKMISFQVCSKPICQSHCTHSHMSLFSAWRCMHLLHAVFCHSWLLRLVSLSAQKNDSSLCMSTSQLCARLNCLFLKTTLLFFHTFFWLCSRADKLQVVISIVFIHHLLHIKCDLGNRRRNWRM